MGRMVTIEIDVELEDTDELGKAEFNVLMNEIKSTVKKSKAVAAFKVGASQDGKTIPGWKK